MAPERKIVGSIEVGMIAIATRAGEGETMTRAESAAPRAGLAGVVRVNEDDVYPALTGLVRDEGLQLPEGPRVMNEALLTTHPNSLSDVGQVFENNGISRSEAIHDVPTDNVIKVSHPAMLSPRQPFQSAFCTRRVFTLEATAQLRVSSSHVHRLFAAELQSGAGCGKIGDTKVYPDYLTSDAIGVRGGHGFAQDDVQVEMLASGVILQGCTRGLLSYKQALLVIPYMQLQLASASYSAQANPEFIPFWDMLESEESFVQVERGRLKASRLTASGLGRLNSSNHTRETPNDVVGGKTVSFFEGIVEPAMQGIRVRYVVLKSHSQSIVTGLGIASKRLVQGIAVFVRDLRLALNGLHEFHRRKYIIPGGESQGRFLRPTQRGRSPRLDLLWTIKGDNYAINSRSIAPVFIAQVCGLSAVWDRSHC
jgi:hypothetical protein